MPQANQNGVSDRILCIWMSFPASNDGYIQRVACHFSSAVVLATTTAPNDTPTKPQSRSSPCSYSFSFSYSFNTVWSPSWRLSSSSADSWDAFIIIKCGWTLTAADTDTDTDTGASTEPSIATTTKKEKNLRINLNCHLM